MSKIGGLPLIEEVILKRMSDMGTSPIDVLATTSTEPLSSNSIPCVSATAAKNVAKATLFKERRGCSEKEMSRSATFPVDTPPTVLELGSLSYTETSPSEHGG